MTGVLTLGHMLGDTIRDTLARVHRMRGEATLWFPGVDHAGLSTQVEVRRRLAKSGIHLEDLPRADALVHIESWKREHEARILEQMRAGGLSVDWSRYRYTMDEGAVRATRNAFVALHQQGLIYRGERIVNWDPRLRTAISDLEVVHTEEPIDLLFIRYPWADGSPGGLDVATVRPETIFGDVAVAVHPDDDRHRTSVGRTVRVPLTDRVVPVIADAGVDPGFGTGALKVTPRHDVLDYEIGQRHPELAKPEELFTPEATLDRSLGPGPVPGPRPDRGPGGGDGRPPVGGTARPLRGQRSLGGALGTLGRGDRAEALHPVVRPRRRAFPPIIEAVRSGAIRIHPERWNTTFFRWMEGLQDWCISRQVFWGHPIPVTTCDACHLEICEMAPPTACPRCGSTHLTDDPDVLDTWFTSWLWPFMALGWPEPTEDLARYYPASVLVTGRDIMFFWVARMMMAGYRFQGKPPFTDVFLTGMLRDEQGRRMSKHLGNSPDPLVVVRERGADTLRFALLFPNPVDQDGPFGPATLDGARNFLTKLWNLARFARMFLPEGSAAPAGPPTLGPSATLEDRWILSRWSQTLTEVDESIARFELTQAAGLLYNFLWHDLADVYVEAAKAALSGKAGEPSAREARATLAFVLDRLLRVLHPMAPHVTEELWHALPHDGEALAVAAWPRADEVLRDPHAEGEMEVALTAVRGIRALRSESKVPPSDTPVASTVPASPAVGAILAAQAPLIARLARLQSFGVLGPSDARPATPARSVTTAGELFLHLEETAASAESLKKEREKLAALLEKARLKLAGEGFRARAPRPWWPRPRRRSWSSPIASRRSTRISAPSERRPPHDREEDPPEAHPPPERSGRTGPVVRGWPPPRHDGEGPPPDRSRSVGDGPVDPRG